MATDAGDVSRFEVVDSLSHTGTFENFKTINGIKWNNKLFYSNKGNAFQFGLYAKPTGSTYYYTDGIRIYLMSYSDLTLDYEVSILDRKQQKCYTKMYHWTFNKKFDDQYNVTSFIRYNVLVDEANRFLQLNDSLVLRLELKVLAPRTAAATDLPPTFDLSVRHNLQTLLDTGEHSDVTLVVGDRSLTAHRSILAAQSPVFSAMFSDHHFVEARDGRVDICDVSAEAMQLVLRYIYTGQLPEMDRLGSELFSVADKYQLDGLKSAAERWLSSTLCVESVADVLRLADQHVATELKRHCVRFITANWTQVRRSDRWAALKRATPDLLIETFDQIVSSLADSCDHVSLSSPCSQ